MLALETKQFGGKLLPHSDLLGGGSVPRGSIAQQAEKSRRMRWDGHVARMGKERELYRVLVGKPERKRPLRRPRPRWVDNIRTDL